MGRYHILLPGQMVLPAKCISCGACTSEAPDFKKYVDLQLDIEFFGALYLCTSCFGSIAEDLGYVPVAQVTEATEKLAKAVAENLDLQARNEALRSGMAALLSGSIQYSGSVDDLIGRVVSAVEESQKPRVPVESIAGTNQGSNTSKRGKGSRSVPDAPADPLDVASESIDFSDEIKL